MASSICIRKAETPSSGWSRNLPRRPHPATGARVRHPSNTIRAHERPRHIRPRLRRCASGRVSALRRSWEMRSSSTLSSPPTRMVSWSSYGTAFLRRILGQANRPGPLVPRLQLLPRPQWYPLRVRGRGSHRPVPGRPYLESLQYCPYLITTLLYYGLIMSVPLFFLVPFWSVLSGFCVQLQLPRFVVQTPFP